MTLFRKKDHKQLDEIATHPSVYDDPSIAQFFAPTARYENLHRFDPGARWTWREELVRQDHLLYIRSECRADSNDRGNLSQANTDNFLEDLGLSTDDYNLGNTVFRLAFLCAVLPSQLISKKLGPDRWSYFFKGTELPFRLALFWTSLRVTDIVAPILAFGLLRLRGYHGYEGWRWLFLFEGILTLTIGIWSWFMMAPSPTQTKSWYRPKGWFTEREEVIMVNRILRDDPSKGDMHNRQAISLKLLWKSLTDFDLWPVYILGLCFRIPTGPPDQYLTLTLRNLGFGTFDSNLLTIPTQFFGAITVRSTCARNGFPVTNVEIQMMIITFYSERFNERGLIGVFCQFWVLPNIIALAVLPNTSSPWARYAILTVLLSFPSGMAWRTSKTWHANLTLLQLMLCKLPGAVATPTQSEPGLSQLPCISESIASANSVSFPHLLKFRSMFVQVSGIVYSNVYRSSDRPFYRNANRALIGVCVMNIFLYLFTNGYYMWRNKVRDREWSALSKEEQMRYLSTTKDSGSKRKDFRFAH
ncbi:major facilitator superfamily transporter [Diaporthe helianthi]|uniref:Major facilitator superfamily transporter n=1 Tax=Diaporthe helianthi TaxID=158607 RepID=A0A2P5HWY5_DIAHE|nr:major facilitator superfamily transporter [Diaporthe helianthi]